MSKLFIAIAIGMFALGVAAGHAISTAPSANAIVKTGLSNVDQVVPFELMANSKNLPVEAWDAF